MKKITLIVCCIALLGACVPSKKFKSLEAKYKSLQKTNEQTDNELASTKSDLNTTKTSLKYCNEEKEKLIQEIQYLKTTNSSLLNNITEMNTLSKKEAENLSTSLEKIKEKDLQIKALNEAVNKKDSITIALVTSIKRAVGNDDKDIEVNVEKGVVLVSISDKFLFTSGSYDISPRANEVLGKVALILKDRPDFEVLIEGHTDNVPFKKGELVDNWDLSVKRATALARTLYTKFKIAPERLIPAGRGPYVPIASNDTEAGRSANRRTKIIIMPKLEQFYGMIEEGMKGGKK